MKRSKSPDKKVLIQKKKPSGLVKTEKSVTAKDIQHYNAILIEDLRSEFKFVIEHTTGVEQRLIHRMDTKFFEIDQNFTDMRRILRSHSEKLDEHSLMFKKNDERLDRIETKLDEHSLMFKKNDERWAKNDKCLDRIEAKLDDVCETVKQHDSDIRFLKEKIPA